MSDLVYVSDAPEVAEYHATLQKRWREWQQQVAAIEAEFPGFTVVYARGFGGFRRAEGLHGPESPGPFWRREGRFWYPNRRFKDGRELSSRLLAIVFRPGTVTGLPNRCYEDHRVFSPSFEPLGSRFWACWGEVSAESVEASEDFNPALWRRAKLSEYYAAKEEAEAEVEVA